MSPTGSLNEPLVLYSVWFWSGVGLLISDRLPVSVYKKFEGSTKITRRSQPFVTSGEVDILRHGSPTPPRPVNNFRI